MLRFLVILLSPILVLLSDLIYVLAIIPPFIPLLFALRYESLALHAVAAFCAIPIFYLEYKLYNAVIKPSLKKLDGSIQASNDPVLFEKAAELTQNSQETISHGDTQDNLDSTKSEEPISFVLRTFRVGSYQFSMGQYLLAFLFLFMGLPLVGGIALHHIHSEIIYLFFIPSVALYFWMEQRRIVLKVVLDRDSCKIYDLRSEELLDTISPTRIQAYIKEFSIPGAPKVMVVESAGVELGRIGQNDVLNQGNFESLCEKLKSRRLLR